jgi:hypothetical protein
MKKSSDQTFMLTTSKKRSAHLNVLSLKKIAKAHILQSALTPVRSVECGLFA